MSEFTYTVIHSNRKTAAIEVRFDGQVIVRVPNRYSGCKVQSFVEEKRPWIERAVKNMEKKRLERERYEKEHPLEKLTREELDQLADDALKDLPMRVRKYAQIIGVQYGRITIRCQKTKWGSCSAKGNLNFNCLLLRAPENVRDYVVIHELCHRKEMNHSPRFWAEVDKVMPDYKVHKKWLRDHGGELMGLVYG